MEFKEQKPRIVAVLHSVFATPKYAVSTSFSQQLFLYYALGSVDIGGPSRATARRNEGERGNEGRSGSPEDASLLLFSSGQAPRRELMSTEPKVVTA